MRTLKEGDPFSLKCSKDGPRKLQGASCRKERQPWDTPPPRLSCENVYVGTCVWVCGYMRGGVHVCVGSGYVCEGYACVF